MRLNLDNAQKKQIGELVRQHLTKNSIENARAGTRKLIGSAKELAHEARVTESIIYRLHSGDFSGRTLQMVETILGVNFREMLGNTPVQQEHSTGANGVATGPFTAKQWDGAMPVRFGGYSREQILPYLDRYIAVRRSVTIPSNFLGTLFEIFWDDELGAARFSEFNKFVSTDGRKMDFSQSGTLHMSAQIGMIHLLTSRQGALRLITLTRLQVIEPVMYGAILTQVPEAGYYMPAKSTIHFRKVDPDDEEAANALLGPITPEHPDYETVRRDLDEADRAIYTR